MKVQTGKEMHDGVDDPSVTPKTGVQSITIRDGEAGQRIDNYLFTTLKGVPKSLIYRILRTGEVRVNKGRIKPLYRLQAGDVLRLPPLRMAEPDAPERIPGRKLEELRASILHEDDDLLVLNKPSGWAVHGGSDVPFGIIEAVRVLRPDLPDVELVHRLDRATSGCLLLAKHRQSLLAAHELLRTGAVEKKYLALVKGRWPAELRRVDVALEKNVLKSGERMVAGGEHGKASITEFKIRSVYKGATLMEVRLLTGRTHQVRVHASHSGYPLAGDDKYGDTDFNKHARQWGLKRLFLHANSVRLKWPDHKHALEFAAPLPDDLNAVLKHLVSNRG